jgi:hypothetical protein
VADKDGRIIAGNKTLEAWAGMGGAVKVVETDGHELVVVQRTDLDLSDPKGKARKLAYYDNRAGQVGLEWDAEQLLADVNAGVDLAAMFHESELEKLLAQNDDDTELPDDAVGGMASPYALKTLAVFPSSNPLGIPDLLPQLLAECPADLETWIGDVSTTPKLAIYQNRSTVGLDKHTAFLSFYTRDYKFDPVWDNTAEIVERWIADGWLAIISPNWSLWSTQPQIQNMYNVFRSRWVARYLQGVGIKVIPDIDWINIASFEFSLLGIPEALPCVSIQCQTGLKNKAEESNRSEGIAHILGTLKPRQLLVYGANSDWRGRIRAIAGDGVQVIHCGSIAMLSRKKLSGG